MSMDKAHTFCASVSSSEQGEEQHGHLMGSLGRLNELTHKQDLEQQKKQSLLPSLVLLDTLT